MTSHKSDVWSGCVTMKNVLVGKAVNKDTHEEVYEHICMCTCIILFLLQISKFIAVVTAGTKTATSTQLDSIITMVCVYIFQCLK